jgi:integrase/recombinase XerD
MSIPEPILVIYSEPPKAIATTDLRQARVDEFLALRSLQPKIRKAYQADLRIFIGYDNDSCKTVSRQA